MESQSKGKEGDQQFIYLINKDYIQERCLAHCDCTAVRSAFWTRHCTGCFTCIISFAPHCNPDVALQTDRIQGPSPTADLSSGQLFLPHLRGEGTTAPLLLVT